MKPLKVKLAAIVKDEAAYLPAWLFHHLYFGFDEIEIYVNNTTDPTRDLVSNISRRFPVRLTEADYIFSLDRNHTFQLEAYSQILESSRADGFSHILFLDIDEFWTPRNFNSSIHDCVSRLCFPDIISFEWANKLDEQLFSTPFSPANKLQPAKHVKSIFDTSLRLQYHRVHNVQCMGATYLLADGSPNTAGPAEKLPTHSTELKPYFIMHRAFRSVLEYISQIGKGRRNRQTDTFTEEFVFKTNRNGYIPHSPALDYLSFSIDEISLDRYYREFSSFCERCQLSDFLAAGQQFVIDRARMVIQNLPTLLMRNSAAHEKLLRFVDLDQLADLLKSNVNTDEKK
ncbi:MAG TPA: glycosyltransferase family 2 protein [Gammaproteobacteria bacterium]|nr:glycosyltransferase family 2 protein [Gammaproteobacteria bacterium]